MKIKKTLILYIFVIVIMTIFIACCASAPKSTTYSITLDNYSMSYDPSTSNAVFYGNADNQVSSIPANYTVLLLVVGSPTSGLSTSQLLALPATNLVVEGGNNTGLPNGYYIALGGSSYSTNISNFISLGDHYYYLAGLIYDANENLIFSTSVMYSGTASVESGKVQLFNDADIKGSLSAEKQDAVNNEWLSCPEN